MQLKDKIIHESLRLFSLKGFLGTTIDDILKVTHSSKGGFYNHFKNKEDLFYHVLEEARSIWQQRNLTGLDSSKSPIDNIHTFLENFRDDYLRDSENFPGGCIFITLLVELKDLQPHLSKDINSGFTGLKKMLLNYLNEARDAGQLKEGVDTEAMASMIFNGILGATIIYNADRSDQSVNQNIGHIINYLDNARA